VLRGVFDEFFDGAPETPSDGRRDFPITLDGK
jgi:hypothetical protein